MSSSKDNKIEKRKGHKYAELEGEEIDEDTINEVLGKTKYQNKTRHAFDGVSAETELSEQQIK